MGSIEFLNDADERPAAPPTRRRPWWLVGALVLALFAAVWTITRPAGHSAPTHVNTPTTAPHAVAASISPEERICREEPNCRRTSVVPPVLRDVISRYLADVESIEVHSYLTRSLFDDATYLVARRIDVVAGAATVAVLVRRQAHSDLGLRPLLSAGSDVNSILVRGDPFGYVVDVQYVAPWASSWPVPRLRALAIEPGLESL